MARRVLHLLSQRPALTGSGVTLDALVRQAAHHGWEQWAVVGTPASDPHPRVGDLPAEAVLPLRFSEGSLDFALPGMSDVMPYDSTRFGAMTPEQLKRYRRAWSDHLAAVVDEVHPDVIHAHHVWIMASLVKDIAPDTPLVVQCHATGLRQMALCPHLAAEVQRGCARAERFLVLHRDHAAALMRALGVQTPRVHRVGAGYRDELFHLRGRSPAPESLLFVGKYSAAKGLPWLLDAVERLARARPALRLHVAGSGAGPEAEDLRRRMEALGPSRVQIHGHLAQSDLAERLRRTAVCVLPSFYEGVPLVLVEALACGCRLVATALPGVVDQLVPRVGTYLELVPLPRLQSVDRPVAEDGPALVDRLVTACSTALDRPPVTDGHALREALAPFTWTAVFSRVERVWSELIDGQAAAS